MKRTHIKVLHVLGCVESRVGTDLDRVDLTVLFDGVDDSGAVW